MTQRLERVALGTAPADDRPNSRRERDRRRGLDLLIVRDGRNHYVQIKSGPKDSTKTRLRTSQASSIGPRPRSLE